MKQKMSGFLLILLLIGLVACGGGDEGSQDSASPDTAVAAGDPAAGETQYNSLCIACHGAEGIGVENLGKPFTTSDFIREQSDAELLTFVKQGRSVSDPANTTGIDMPPKGGNPALNDAQIMDIIAYIRTLQE